VRVTYLLEGTELFGGTKVALRQANLLAARGHRVTVLAKGPRPDWLPVDAAFERLATFEGLRLADDTVCVATYWTTIEPAAASGAVAVHYCQGFEGSYTHNRGDHAAIDAAYRTPIPALTVAPHLAELIEGRFGRPARTVAQPLEPAFRPARLRRRPARPPRILVVGPWEIDWKGVATALRAIEQLRARGFACRSVRLSQWPQGPEERAVHAADEVHIRLAPPRVAELVRRCDLLLAPSWQQEGFGLPVLEALACGVPVVASDIPPFRWFAHPAAALVPVGDAGAFAETARETLTDRALWRKRRRLGFEAVRPFTGERPARQAEAALAWALERAGR